MIKRTFIFFICFLFSGVIFAQTDDELVDLLPRIEGWEMPGQPEIYTEENLYDYINGNNELYLSYGFRKVVSGYFENENDAEQSVTVDIYDMGTALGAFGVYSSMTHPDYEYEAIGCEAIVSPMQIQFWQHRFEVEIRASGAGPGLEVLKRFSLAVAEKLPTCEEPGIKNWLPESNQIPHSFKFIQTSFLGQDYLPGGVEALFNLNGLEVKGFAVKTESETEAFDFLKKYQTSQQNFEGIELEANNSSFYAYHKYLGHICAEANGKWLFGSNGMDSAPECRKLCEKIKSHLQKLEY